MTIINYEAKWLVEPWLRQNGWTERQIFGIITIIIIAIIMINGVIIDSRPRSYFSFVNNDFPSDKFKREREMYKFRRFLTIS